MFALPPTAGILRSPLDGSSGKSTPHDSPSVPELAHNLPASLDILHQLIGIDYLSPAPPASFRQRRL